jgi:hypothetical protein
MVKMMVDQKLEARFRDVPEAEICDESGQTLGRFLSEAMYRRLVYDWVNAQVSDEELRRSFQQPGGKTLAEIRARLEAQ